MRRTSKKEQKFGGLWTIDKLSILSDYLNAYTNALKNQPFNKIYIDAFAGTGNVDIIVDESILTIDGSARLALNSNPTFDRYYFIERNKTFSEKLKEVINKEYAPIKNKVSIINDDCNTSLITICKNIDWNKNRALLFLDPYAMDVNWETLKLISETRAIDIWYLFPLSATNRLLKKDGQIPDSWRVKLNQIFGNEEWFSEIYKEDPQLNIFQTQSLIKEINIEGLTAYIILRLETIFARVSKNPRILYNHNGTPLFLFCFAVSNGSLTAQNLAMKIAEHILKK